MVRFFFSDKDKEGLPIGLQKRIPILVNLIFILLGYFIFASTTRYLADPENSAFFFYSVLSTNLVFILSLVLVRKKRYSLAANLSMIGLLLNSLWIGIFLPSIGEGDLYRLVLYLIASSAVNSMLAMYDRQILLYGLYGYLILVFSTFFTYAPRFGGFTDDLRTVFITMTLLYVPLTIVFLFTNRLAVDLIALAEKELAKNQSKTKALNEIIRTATESMEIGRHLLKSTEESNRRSSAIRQALSTIQQTSGSLSGASGCADSANEEIIEYADQMKEAIHQQNTYFQQTSAAFNQMITAIQETSDRAQQRKADISATVQGLEAQAKEITSVLESFENIRSSSAQVLSVAGGILDVSEKTNLLAMNASIEAAHSGAAGKGFAVIAGEIRKLSQETKVSTQAIAQALARNDDTVKQSSGILQRYSSNTKSLVQGIQQIFGAIEEIITTMSEVSASSHQINQATASMMALVQTTNSHVSEINQRLQDNTDSLTQISSFACALDEKLGQLSKDFLAIEGIIAEVRQIGEQNIVHIRTLEKDLKEVE
ncbi:MAG: hypothetical protein GW949_08405 [Spirochaetales bacterium]|nr:hypothetical protein [Spirochaetales bacterium]